MLTKDHHHVLKVHFEELRNYLSSNHVHVGLSKFPSRGQSDHLKLTRLSTEQFYNLSTDVYEELIQRKNERENSSRPQKEDLSLKSESEPKSLAIRDVTAPPSFPAQTDRASRTNLQGSLFPALAAIVSTSEGDATASLLPKNAFTWDEGQLLRTADGGLQDILVTVFLSSMEDLLLAARSNTALQLLRSLKSVVIAVTSIIDDIETYVQRLQSEDNLIALRSLRQRANIDVLSSLREQAEFSLKNLRAVATLLASNSGTFIDQVIALDAAASQMSATVKQIGRTILIRKATETEQDALATRLNDSNGFQTNNPAGYSLSNGYFPESKHRRSGARLRLAGLPTSDFVNVCNDIHLELVRRHPELQIDHSQRQSDFDSYDQPLGAEFARLSGSVPSEATSSAEKGVTRQDQALEMNTLRATIIKLQSNLDQANDKKKKSQARVKQLEKELAAILQLAEEQRTELTLMRKETEELKEACRKDATRSQEGREELEKLQNRYNQLEEEKELRQGWAAMNSDEALEQITSEMEGLRIEINALSWLNEKLMAAKKSDNNLIRDLNDRLKESNHGLRQAKKELTAVKALSQVLLRGPDSDRDEDQLPAALDGGLPDVHFQAFLSAIEGLLIASRRKSATRLLRRMKAVTNAVTTIVEDVKAYQQRAQSHIDLATLLSLGETAESSLSTMVSAVTAYASSSEVASFSILDAAVVQVYAAVKEIGKRIFIRKVPSAEKEPTTYSSGGSTTDLLAAGWLSLSRRPSKKSKSMNTRRPRRQTSSNHANVIRLSLSRRSRSTSLARTTDEDTEYSRAPSRTESTDYGYYFRRMCLSRTGSRSSSCYYDD